MIKMEELCELFLSSNFSGCVLSSVPSSYVCDGDDDLI